VPPTFRRKNIRLPREQYVGLRRYFITILCADRRPLLAHHPTAQLVIATLRKTAHQHNFAIYSYCAMPDHLHFLAVGTRDDADLLNFVMVFKRSCTIAHAAHRGGPLWRKKFYDHILRDAAPNGPAATYIRMNPVRAGLCADANAYEFAGSFVSDWPAIVDNDTPPWIPPWRQ
jgi:putative transposase